MNERKNERIEILSKCLFSFTLSVADKRNWELLPVPPPPPHRGVHTCGHPTQDWQLHLENCIARSNKVSLGWPSVGSVHNSMILVTVRWAFHGPTSSHDQQHGHSGNISDRQCKQSHKTGKHTYKGSQTGKSQTNKANSADHLLHARQREKSFGKAVQD